VRSACINAAASPDEAIDSFLAVMAWGHGQVGYGVWRTATALSDPESGTNCSKSR
jgi:hypothetical protein